MERNVSFQKGVEKWAYVLQADLYNKLSQAKVIEEAALRSGINRGAINAAWDAIGSVIKAWATEGHSVAIPGLGSLRFGLRSVSVADVNKVGTDLITSRRIIFIANSEIKEELAKTSINITCYDRNGVIVKRVTSADDSDIEEENDNDNDNENDNSGNGEEQTPKKTVNLTVSPVGAGTVTGGGQYDSGASVNIGATAASGYHFVKWNDNSTSANRTLNVLDSDIDLQAIFEADAPEDDNPGGNEGGMANY